MDNMDKNTAELIERIITEREALRHENKELKEVLKQCRELIELQHAIIELHKDENEQL